MTKNELTEDLKKVAKKFFKENKNEHFVPYSWYRDHGGYKSSAINRFFKTAENFMKSVKRGDVVVISKKDITDDFIVVANDYFEKFPQDSYVPRGYWRSKKSPDFSEQHMMGFFGSYDNLKETYKNPNPAYVTREDLVEVGDNRGMPNKFMVSAITAGGEIPEELMKAAAKCCREENRQLILLSMKGTYNKYKFDTTLFEKYKIYPQFNFNDNLRAHDFMLTPQQIKPSTGLTRFGQGDYSVITAHTKQELQTLSAGITSHPHIFMTTGAFTGRDYGKNRIGEIANQDHVFGAINIDIKNKKKFTWRHIQFDDSFGFNTMGKYYKGDKVIKSIPVSIDCEPHLGVEDPDAIQCLKEQIESLEVPNCFFNDLIDFSSVNRHDVDNLVLRCQKQPHQQSLKQELDHAGRWMEEWCEEHPKLNNYRTPSNHELFLHDYLCRNDFRSMHPDSTDLCTELRLMMMRGIDPTEFYIRENFNIPNFHFPKIGDSMVLGGIEHLYHGHIGMKGAKGSVSQMEKRAGNKGRANIGHSHSPLILRGIWYMGCHCLLRQPYNMSSGSDWAHGSLVTYANGNRQILLSIGKEWR